MSALPSLPTFDPDSADRVILGEAERVRALRVLLYALDGVPNEQVPDVDLVRAEEDQQAAESIIAGEFASTVPGVVARLLLLIPRIDESRWVDRGLAEQGFLALYLERDRLPPGAQQAVLAVHELLHIEWQQNLDAYERSKVDFDLALKGKRLVDEAMFGGDVSDFAKAMDAHVDACEHRFSNCSMIRRLVRTLAPDHDAYLRKVAIIIAEQWSGDEDPSPWLARDTAFLIGRIETNERKAA